MTWWACVFAVNLTMPAISINQSHKPYNAPAPYPTMYHYVTEMCTYVHIFVTNWCIVGYFSDALCDLWDDSLVIDTAEYPPCNTIHRLQGHHFWPVMDIDEIIISYKQETTSSHDDVIKWKHFPRYWPFVRGIHRSRWISRTKTSDAELWCFLWSASE